MEQILPELLLHIFDLVVHTPDNCDSAFLLRTPVRGPKHDRGPASEDTQQFGFDIDDRYPDFPPGITAHALSTQSPLQLGHVCREWRHLVFAESSLWSSIYTTNGRPGFLHLFELWIRNSGSQLLNIVFRDGEMADYSEPGGEVVADMFTLAVLHHRRWSSLKIRTRRVAIPLIRISSAVSPTMEMPNLRTLAFSFVDAFVPSLDEADQFNAVWGRLVKNSPQLEEMQMWDTMDYDIAFLISLPFPRLKVITLPMVAIGGDSLFVASLAQCACLRTLSISLTGCDIQSIQAYTIAIPSLTNLDLSGIKDDVNNSLQFFHLPSLIALSIHANTDPSMVARTGPWDGLKRALDHWKPKLQSLSLRDSSASQFELHFLPLLHHPALQSLVHLRVGGLVGSKFMEALTVYVHQPNSSPLRNLQHIHIESAYFGVDQGLATRMALSRRKGCSANLHSLRVDFLSEEEMNLETAEWDACVDMGLGRVDRRFGWIGVGRRVLEREFMIRDFSMIQGWH